MRLDDNYILHKCLEKNHVFNGPNRSISEAEGFTVWLCLEHHRNGPDAVHRNIQAKRLLQQDAQRTFEKSGSRQEFMRLIGENFL